MVDLTQKCQSQHSSLFRWAVSDGKGTFYEIAPWDCAQVLSSWSYKFNYVLPVLPFKANLKSLQMFQP